MIAAVLSLVLAVPPRVTCATPDHGDAAVSPALTQLRVEFDQDMSTGAWSVCGGGDTFPRIDGKVRWETPRVLVIPVKLEPSHEYHISMNCPSAHNTRSAAGEAAEVTPLWFRTSEAPAAPPALPTPQENQHALDTLQRVVQEEYSYRDRVVKDWPALFAQHRAALVQAKSRAAFAREAGRMLAQANDLHVSLAIGDPDGWNVRFPSAVRSVVPNVDLNTVEAVVPNFKKVSELVSSGSYPDGVLYLAVHECSDTAADQAANVVSEARAPGAVTRVVLDLRRNAGGDELAARRIAGLFLEKTRVYSRNRYRDPTAQNGWGPMHDREVLPAPESDRILVPMAVLVGPCCMSSCESLVLMLKGAPRVTTIGTRTYGSSGNPRRTDLGNGVAVWMSSWEDFGPAGEPVEGVGVAPDVQVRTDPGDFQASDPVLERALKALRKE